MSRNLKVVPALAIAALGLTACSDSTGDTELLDRAITFADDMRASSEPSEIIVDPRPGRGPGGLEVPAGGDWFASVYCLTDGTLTIQFDGEVAARQDCELGTMFGASGSSAEGPVEVGIRADEDQYWVFIVTESETG